MLNGSLGWLNVGLGCGGLDSQLGFFVEVEEKRKWIQFFFESVNGKGLKSLVVAWMWLVQDCGVVGGWSRIEILKVKQTNVVFFVVGPGEQFLKARWRL